MLKSIYNHFITPLTSRKLSAAILGNVIIGIGVAGLRYSTLGNDPYSASTMAISDGLGMGLGFTLALLLMGTIREVLGNGTWFGIRLIPAEYSVGIMTGAPGGFFTFGCMIALLAAVTAKWKQKNGDDTEKPFGCPGSCEGCVLCGGGEEAEK